MSKIDELISLIKESETVIRFNKLRSYIYANEEYLNKYNEIIELQKKALRTKNKELLVEIENKLNLLTDDVVISEYLSLLEEINDISKTINNIITYGLEER